MRYSPGIYTIINRNTPTGSTLEYFLDNMRYELFGDTMVTIRVHDNLVFDAYNPSYNFITKIGTLEDSIVGNTSMFTP
jgi:hypothetical protein